MREINLRARSNRRNSNVPAKMIGMFFSFIKKNGCITCKRIIGEILINLRSDMLMVHCADSHVISDLSVPHYLQTGQKAML